MQHKLYIINNRSNRKNVIHFNYFIKKCFLVMACFFHWHLQFILEMCGNDFCTGIGGAMFSIAVSFVFIEKFGELGAEGGWFCSCGHCEVQSLGQGRVILPLPFTK